MAAAANDIFTGILGQPKVRDYLRTCIADDRVSQAYLFSGPAGSNKTQAAFAFAAALICGNGGCGQCDTCKRVLRRTHPDVRFYQPEGANAYLIDQIREIVADEVKAPIQAKRKVYIIDRADLLSISAANAFLKTLEEPSGDTVFILLARTMESVLPTILSRCQVVAFRHIPPTEAAGIVGQNTGVSSEHARIAIESCDGSITRAVEFALSNEQQELRRNVLAALASLEHADMWDILGFSRDLVVQAKAPLDAVRAQHEQDIEASRDFLSATAKKRLEQRRDRRLSAKTKELLLQVTSVTRTWLRDALMYRAGTPQLAVNVDARASAQRCAAKADTASILAAIAATRECDRRIAYNVGTQASIDAMLLEIATALYGPFPHSA